MAEKKDVKKEEPVETPAEQESLLPEGTLATPDSVVKARRPLT